VALQVCCLLLVAVATANAQEWRIERLPDPINSASCHEVPPVMSADGQTLYFTRVGAPDFERAFYDLGRDLAQDYSEQAYWTALAQLYSELSGQRVVRPIDHPLNQDIWVAHFANHNLVSVEHPGMPLNNAYPNSICAITPNPNTFICLNQFPQNGGINRGFSTISQTDGVWQWPQPIDIDDYHTSQIGLTLTLNSNGQVMLLSLERKEGYGDTDLYVSQRTGPQSWSRPVNLGPKINSPLRELTPALSADGRILYFASDRAGSAGGTDLFYAMRQDDSWTNWSEPRRFIDPINTQANEIQPFFHPVTGHLFFCSDREGTYDIFKIQITPPAEPPAIASSAEQPASQPVANSSIKVLIKDKFGMLVSDLPFFVQLGTAQKSYANTQTFSLLAGQTATISIQDKRYIALPVRVSTAHGAQQTIEITVESAAKGRTIELKTVFFERTTARLLPESQDEIARLAMLMQQRPDLVIRIEGHTDNQGKRSDLIELSERRAKAVKEQLAQAGIDPKRLRTIGYGPDKPINQNDTELSRSRNRRVEFSIAKMDE
jgi:outer membrane protein OmpA-like peptidoglycan-associated protein